MRRRRMIVCVQCGETRPFEAKNRCSACYQDYRHTGSTAPPRHGRSARLATDRCVVRGCTRPHLARTNFSGRNAGTKNTSRFCGVHLANPDLRNVAPAPGIDRFRSKTPDVR